ncbi:DUF2752 domain-containing protein [Enterococcus canintestini]|uniref:DUF2752 domain-containing protein n=1 Tax=Enterococcus canintestini TaxID=317010 RepID=UPI00288D707B|nr:DUF2752 domain-containing protein [Enterococcus canintestini]MDT2738768.1 DUF2752 domain-containing protein [Enterococcus canintestini]
MVGLLECPLRAITGVPCPMCGMTRSFIHLAHGDISGAFSYHPLFWVIILLVLLYFISLKKAGAQQVLKNKYWWLSIAVLFICVYFIRMMTLFPDKAPLDFNFNAFLPKLWQIFTT